ncbi:AMP-binding protein [Nocardia sp. X0981]
MQPTILRMLLDADVASEDLSSLEYLPGGSSPLDPDLRAEFERRFGVVLLWGYGAAEFAGSVCAWTADLCWEFGAGRRAAWADRCRVRSAMPTDRIRTVEPRR